MNFSRALRMRTPGRRPASQRIWKPLQTPSTSPPPAAKSRTASIIGARPAMLQQRNHTAPKSIQFSLNVTNAALHLTNVALEDFQNLINQLIADFGHLRFLSHSPR